MKRIIMTLAALICVISMLGLLCSCFGGEAGDPGEDGDHTHTPEKVEAVAATCTEMGNNEYYKCTGCDMVFTDEACETETTVEEQIVWAPGHTEKATQGDCTAGEIVCSVCGETLAAAEEHSYSNACDSTCNVDGCSGGRTPAAHVPSEDDNDCTTGITCTVCGITLMPGNSTHSYSADCDPDCDNFGCDAERSDMKSHTDVDGDEVCDVCGDDCYQTAPGSGSGEDIDLGMDSF